MTALLATLAALLPAADHKPLPCWTVACRERVAMHDCSQARPIACIRRAALHQRVSFTLLHARAWCESRLIPWASNGSHSGLFQFRTAEPSTWATTPYADRDPLRAKWNALAAAWMERRGRGSEWACWPT
jgi:hypothetical protein